MPWFHWDAILLSGDCIYLGLGCLFPLASVWKWGVRVFGMGTPTDDAVAAHVAFCRSRIWGSIYRPIYETNPPMPQVATFRSPTVPSGILLVDTPVAEQVDEDVGPV